MSIVAKVVGKTDIGLVRSGNEDYLHLDEDHQVYAVCDGMGGHQAGEIASMTAAETLLKIFSHFDREILDDPALSVGRTLPPKGELLLKATRLANRAIFNKASEDPALAGMGTTIVAVGLEADLMAIVHVGDSRAYRLREDRLEPLTKDHSWLAELQESQNLSAEEASSAVGKNVITRALGVRENVEADFRAVKVTTGETYILCSDGLCGFADDDEIFDVATEYRSDGNKLAGALVQMANDRGGSDNVTIIVIQIVSADESPLPPLDAFTLPAERPDTLEAEDLWLKKLDDLASLANDKGDSEGTTVSINRTVLLSLFLIFIIAAVVIIWFMPE